MRAMRCPTSGRIESSNAPGERPLSLLPAAGPVAALAGAGLSLPRGLGPGLEVRTLRRLHSVLPRHHPAVGTLADADTRHWRSLAHRGLDPLWQGGGRSRSAVYPELAAALRLSERQA